MAHGPDWSSDSEDSLLADDGDYENFKKTLRAAKIPHAQRELTEEEKKQQSISEFFYAATSGSAEAVRDFISKGFDIDLPLQDGWTALMLTVSYGHLDVVRLLIEAGANVNKDRGAVTPLMMACNCPSDTTPFEKSFEIIKLLVEHGASIQEINRKRMDALMYAACNGNLLAVEYLLPKANKQALDNQRWSALTWAVSNNQPEVVKYLSGQGFDMDLQDVRGYTPMDIAKENGLNDIISLFPSKESDLVAEILGRSSKAFQDIFEGLSKGQKPSFFEDICDFLLSVKCDHLIPLFLERNVTLSEFLAMNDNDLKQIGVLLPYQRNRILTGLHRFHKQPYHPQSLHVCVKSDCFSNVDVATKLLSAVKQVICMEASLKYLQKHLERQKLSKEDGELVKRNINTIRTKINNFELVVRKLNRRFKKWDAIVAPPDLITRNSIRSHFPWKKVGFCASILGLIIVYKFRRFF